MATKPKKSSPREFPPAVTDLERENQLISLALDAAEQQMRDGTASSQVISHFLKLGSTKERLEREMMEEQKKLLKAKTENIESQKRIEALYAEAIDAMRKYSGNASEEE